MLLERIYVVLVVFGDLVLRLSVLAVVVALSLGALYTLVRCV